MNTHSLVENDYVALLYSWDIRKMVVLIMLEPISKFLFVCSGRVNYNRTALDFFHLQVVLATFVCLFKCCDPVLQNSTASLMLDVKRM